MIDQDSTEKPKIVDTLLGEEVVDVACGARHVVVLTNDAENPVYTWGRDSAGCLGKNDRHKKPTLTKFY